MHVTGRCYCQKISFEAEAKRNLLEIYQVEKEWLKVAPDQLVVVRWQVLSGNRKDLECRVPLGLLMVSRARDRPPVRWARPRTTERL